MATQHWVFSFGSNNSQQLAGRVLTASCPPLAKPQAARLDGYARVFTGMSQAWSGGVANLVPCPQHHVLGTLVRLSSDQLERLDQYERAYQKQRVAVLHLGTRSHVDATAYVMEKSPAFTAPPSEAYLAAIWRTLREAHPSVEDIPLLCQSVAGGQVDPFGEGQWRHPGTVGRLSSCFALAYEIGATCQPPWVLPRDAAAAAQALEQAGVSSVPQLVTAMSDAVARTRIAHALGPAGFAALQVMLELPQPAI
jgi:gamma-glutamylcyclotransferase (GGCT)/AIG2-like uncharacterized protein YtfP